MARFGAPRGLNGEIKLQLYCRQPDFFIQQKQWWCRHRDARYRDTRRAGAPAGGGGDDGWQVQAVVGCKNHNGGWFVKLGGVDDRDAALLWRQGEAALLRSALPPPDKDEYYWCDLLGLSVANGQGEDFGRVADIFHSGASDILRVRDDGGREVLIPFGGGYVTDIDFDRACVRVDWQRDW